MARLPSYQYSILPILRNLLASIFIVLLGTNHVAANGLILDLTNGASVPSAGGYKSDFAADVAIGYQQARVVYRAGITYLGELERQSSDIDAYIKAGGAYLQANARVEAKGLDIELGGGIMLTHADAYFDRRQVGHDNNLRPFLDARLFRPINTLFGLQAGWKYINDLSGSDLHVFHFGARFSF